VSLTCAPNSFKYNPKGTDKGSLMNYETTDGAFNGLTRLYSPVLGRTSASCEFEFFYYKVNDPKATTLALFFEYQDSVKERLWRVDTNSNNNDWTRARVSLHSRKAGGRLFFEASQIDQVGAMKPLLAIDSTKFINCQTVFNVSCSQANVFQCSNGSCIPYNKVTLI
jgi:hypothetical protein